ncbi:YbaY family lipoprotein [Marimonas arenosa]|uniref:YbaY family lipoprotein n=1 Tax=Marimonas arenosa TaxID=1795305 RepID=A0AAE4B6S5_9RHOB|nr:YbaY family lipoprotein [Marimonas arenosa]MDQ2091654.1 YbaY family lipoprotein [Marimonas arenosa]
MRNILRNLALTIVFLVTYSNAEAETNMLEVTVTYRERIALPPDAQLDVQLLDISRAGVSSKRIASQRSVMTSVPMTVALNYDARMIDEQDRYAVVATIWSGDKQMFRTAYRHDAFGDAPVEIILSMVADEDTHTPLSRSISGIAWAVTEIEGIAWINDDPATLLIDEEGNFSAFGGCNRFSGTLLPSDGGIAFPQDFAATMMACPDEIEAFERRFINALVRASDYVRYGAGLVIIDSAGNSLLHFEERLE